MESHLRSIVKALTWRSGGTIVTFAVAFFITRELELAAKVGVLDTVVKIAAFYFHERLWHNIRFGKLKPPEYEI
jgi:uncharacterized membrane protein